MSLNSASQQLPNVCRIALVGQLLFSPAAALSSAFRFRKLSGATTLPLRLRSGRSHSIKFGCIVTKRFLPVLLERTVIRASLKSMSLHCNVLISEGRKPAKSPIVQYDNISGLAAAISLRASSTLKTATSVLGSFARVVDVARFSA